MADRDCVFAPAYCTALVHGKDPGSFLHDQLKYYEKTFRAMFVQYEDDSFYDYDYILGRDSMADN